MTETESTEEDSGWAHLRHLVSRDEWDLFALALAMLELQLSVVRSTARKRIRARGGMHQSGGIRSAGDTYYRSFTLDGRTWRLSHSSQGTTFERRPRRSDNNQ